MVDPIWKSLEEWPQYEISSTEKFRIKGCQCHVHVVVNQEDGEDYVQYRNGKNEIIKLNVGQLMNKYFGKPI